MKQLEYVLLRRHCYSFSYYYNRHQAYNDMQTSTLAAKQQYEFKHQFKHTKTVPLL